LPFDVNQGKRKDFIQTSSNSGELEKRMTTFTLKPTLLAVPFVASALLAGCVSQSDYDALQLKYNQLNAQYAQSQQQSAAQLAANEEHANHLQQALLFSLSDDMLFSTGSWQLSTNGQEQLGGLAQKWGAYQRSKVIVNGYTDNVPIGADLRKQGVTTNDELSQKRAETVMNWLVQHGANSNPVASNDTKAGRAKNRRVEITKDTGSAETAAQ
jgi:chemotaxis protein MotB